MNPPTDFLRALFHHIPPGFIEVRLIEDRKSRTVVERQWYGSIKELVGDMPRLLEAAAKRTAAIFFGVLPRVALGRGKVEDTLPSVVVWADVDFKDFPGGEAEARERVRQFSLLPSIVVRSAHGLHLYWLIREPTDPAILSQLSKGIAQAVGGDRTFDAARLLRVPGTYNRKDPANPVLVEIEELDPTRTYNPSDLEDALNIVGCPPEAEPARPTAEELPTKILQAIPPEVRIVLGTQPKIRDLFHGVGKEPTDRNGRPQDCSSSGYDSSLLCALIKKGITVPDSLATVLWHRPDGEAREKGRTYIERTVAKALGFMSDKESKAAPDVTVERIRRFDQIPARYELTIEGKTITLETPDLLGQRRFMTIFTDHFGRVPVLPENDDWLPWINEILSRAELVPMPPEASEDPAIRDAILTTIDDLQDGEDLDGLDSDKLVLVPSGEHAGEHAFRLDAVLRRVNEDFPNVKRGDVGVHLRRLGFTDGQVGIAGRRRRVWFKRTKDARGETESAS